MGINLCKVFRPVTCISPCLCNSRVINTVRNRLVLHDRGNPDRIHAQILQIIQFLSQTREVTAVVAGIQAVIGRLIITARHSALIVRGITIKETVCHCKVNYRLIPIEIGTFTAACNCNLYIRLILIIVHIIHSNRKGLLTCRCTLLHSDGNCHQFRINRCNTTANSTQVYRGMINNLKFGCILNRLAFTVLRINLDGYYIVIIVIHGFILDRCFHIHIQQIIFQRRINCPFNIFCFFIELVQNILCCGVLCLLRAISVKICTNIQFIQSIFITLLFLIVQHLFRKNRIFSMCFRSNHIY